MEYKNIYKSIEKLPQLGSIEMRGFEWEAPYPVMIYNSSSDTKVETISQNYNIPKDIVIEVISLLQNIGFIQSENETIVDGIDLAPYQNKNTASQEEVEESLDTFFSKLSQLDVIQQYKEKNANLETLPWGVFRITSLYDMDFTQFTNIWEFLDFLYTNIEISEKFFKKDYFDALQEVTGLQVSWIEAKTHSHFVFKKTSYDIGSIQIQNQDIPLKCNIIPGFSPCGLVFTIALDLPNNDWMNSADNFFYIFWFYFQKDKRWEIIPTLHTIQNSPHNIGCNKKWELMSLKDPLSKEQKEKGQYLIIPEEGDDEKLLAFKKSLQQKITQACKKMTAWVDPEEEFLAMICDKFFQAGNKKITVVDTNLWLTQHTDRDQKSIAKTMEEKYDKKLRNIGAKIDTNNQLTLNHQNLLSYLWSYPKIDTAYINIKKSLEGLESKLSSTTNKPKQVDTNRKWINTSINTILDSTSNIHQRSSNLERIEQAIPQHNIFQDDPGVIASFINTEKNRSNGIESYFLDEIIALQRKIDTIIRNIDGRKIQIDQDTQQKLQSIVEFRL